MPQSDGQGRLYIKDFGGDCAQVTANLKPSQGKVLPTNQP
jgi:hypothetical protein